MHVLRPPTRSSGTARGGPVTGSFSFECCGVRIDPLGLPAAARALEELALRGRGETVHLCNANNLALARGDAEYARVLNRGALNLPDGAPLVLLARRLAGSGLRQAQRPRGADVMTSTMDIGRRRGLRHFLYGSDSTTLAALTERLQQDCPGVEIVGAESPPFRVLTEEEEVATVGRIVAAEPDIVWLALGTPRQDYVADAFCNRVNATLVAVGAAFDFVAGMKPSAPGWVQRAGLEWLFRLATEPRRLWRRYLVGTFAFLRCAGHALVFGSTRFRRGGPAER